MTDQSPLIVPMTVEAFVVNGTNISMLQYGGVSMDYADMLDLFNAQQGLLSEDPPQNTGVYLKWRLPAAFTAGVQDSAGGRTTFPPVPNRWIVIRCSGAPGATSREATAWIIESDTITSSSPSSAYLQTDPAQVISIGVSTLLAGGWSEQQKPSVKLTAVAPGNHAFAYFQPTCNNVFSFVDTSLTGDQQASYMVAGWFSDPSEDPLAGAADDFLKVIAKLGWNIAKADDSLIATSTLVYGFVDNVTWSAAPPKNSQPQTTADVGIAIGNTSIEALTALIEQQNPGLDPQLLEALQLDMVENLDAPDGEAMLQQKLQSTFFKRFGGGYVWSIVGAPHSGKADPAELAMEAALLTTLNAAQEQLDDDLRQLAYWRAQLYIMWWKHTAIEMYKPPGKPIVTRAELEKQLEADVDGSVASKVLQYMTAVESADVPNGKTMTQLQAAIEIYAMEHNLPASRCLKRTANPSFYEINNPVALISNANANGIGRTPKQVNCRFGFAGTTELISEFVLGGTFPTSSSAPPPVPLNKATTNLPWWNDAVQALYLEFFLLDPANAAQIAAALGQSAQTVQSDITNELQTCYPKGTLPDPTAVQRWSTNPWHPLFLYWSTQYSPIGYDEWMFQDGEYVWTAGVAPDPIEYQPTGLIILSPTAELNLQARITAFLQNNPHLPRDQKKAFNDLLNDVSWDLLSQSLDGFNEQLQFGTPGAYISPAFNAPWLTKLLGGVGSYPPAQIGVEVPLTRSTKPDQFQPWRAGQIVVSTLTIIDEWGQALDLIGNRQLTLAAPDEFQPLVTSNDAAVQLHNGHFVRSIVNHASSSATLQIERLHLDGETLTIEGGGFPTDPSQPVTVNWNGTAVSANVASDGTSLTATVSTSGITGLVPVNVTILGPQNDDEQTHPLLLPPALLQPGQLDFSLVDATNDAIPFGPANPAANPICGWVVPNHLDHSLVAFDAAGRHLGDLSIEITGRDRRAVRWTNAPFSPYPKGLKQIAEKVPHFGDFLLALSEKEPRELTAVMKVIDDSLWTTLPSSASFDQNLAVFMGRPLAMVRASLQFLLDGPPVGDPSWQYTFDPQTPAFTSYKFSIQLGDPSQLEDGLIGYFTGDDYATTFNVVQQTDPAKDDYFKLIGLGNYIKQPFDGTTVTYVSMLVDPRGTVHASSGILPTVTATLPPQFVAAALARMSVTFRVSGAITDQVPATPTTPATILIPTRREPGAGWHWLENDGGKWTRYDVGPNDANARLSPTPPVLRSGLLDLSLKGAEA